MTTPQPVPKSRRPGRSSSNRKRKLSDCQPSASPPAAPTQQQTIKQLFSTSEAKQKALSADASPNSKRAKAGSNGTVGVTEAAPPPRTPSKMYSFSSNKHASNGTVDLTSSSPNGSPSPRKPTMARPIRPTFNPHAGAKKLVVKNLRTSAKRSDPDAYLEQVWAQLDDALTSIFQTGKVTQGKSMEELYRGVENVCRQGRAAELYNRLEKRCHTFVGEVVNGGLLARAGDANVDILKAVLDTWHGWNARVTTIRSIFFYLDRAYLLQSGEPSLQEVSVDLFRQSVFEDPVLKPKIVDGACDMVDADRKGQPLDEATFHGAIAMFHDLLTYTSVFEPRLLGLSQSYILLWSDKASSELGLPEYVTESMNLMKREQERCERFGLDSTTKRDLLTLLEDHLIQRRQEKLTNPDEFADLLEADAESDLENLYGLLNRRRLGAKLRPAFEKWIDNTGSYYVFNEQKEDSMVVNLLALKSKLDRIWRHCFRRDEELGHGLRESFETFMNKTKKGSSTWGTDNSKPGEMIAKYLDVLLRSGAKAISSQPVPPSGKAAAAAENEADDSVDEDTVVNDQLDHVLDLFRFVHGKAVFEAFYKKDLARRLMMGRSASADAERSMLARLKTECGAGFTQNLEQMFRDVELSREEVSSYKTIMSEREEASKIDLNVNILSAAAWPSYPDIPVQVPPDIQAALAKFDEHYRSKHRGRKLDWKHALAHCQIKANFPKGKKELVVSSFQAFVLLLFNNVKQGEHLTYEHLLAETGLPEADLKRTLQSLACAKIRPLTKHPKGREVDPTDTFTLDPSFNHPKYRVKINQVQMAETKAENKATHEQVAADRGFETQAAIVRTMKARKTIGHSELVAEVIKATRSRGVLDVSGIKKHIDRLVEKEYMERIDGNMYSYIA